MLGQTLRWWQTSQMGSELACEARVTSVEFAEPRQVEVFFKVGGRRFVRTMTWADWGRFKHGPDAYTLPPEPEPPFSRLVRRMREAIELKIALDRWADDGGALSIR